MQKRFLPMLAIASAAVILFSSCSKNNKQGRYIPENAAVVVHIDGKSLNEKLPWEEVKQNEIFKEALADTSLSDLQKKIMEDPANSGIDVKSDMEGFLVVNKEGSYIAFEGSITDREKFKQAITQAHKTAAETTKGDYTYYADHKGAIAYNKERFFAVFDAPMAYNMTHRNSFEDMSTDTSFGGVREEPKADMNKIAENLINLKESESLAESKKFSSLLDTKGDVHLWYSVEQLMGGTGMMGAGSPIKMDILKGMIYTAAVNFENGKIVADMKTYAGSELSDLYEKYEGSDFDKSMVKNIPSQNLAGFFAMNFKPEAIRAILKLMGMDGMANIALARFGISLDDIIKAPKGDFVFAVTDLSNEVDSFGIRKKPNFILAGSMGDRPSFDKVLGSVTKLGAMGMGNGKSGMSVNEKFFAFATDKSFADAYLAGNSKSSFPILDKIPSGPAGGFVDFRYIFKVMQPKPDADSTEKAMFDISAKVWDNLIMSGGNFKGGGMNQHFEVNMMDRNTNSLKQLNAYMGKLMLLKKAEDKKREEMWKMEDGTIITPDVRIDESGIQAPRP